MTRFFSLLLFLTPAISAWAGEAEPSPSPTPFADLYKKYCSACHGKGGDGKSSAAQGMTPLPTDFTSPDALVVLTRERMLQSVTEGRPHTAMTAWKDLLRTEEIAGVVDYIRTTLMLASRAQDASQGRRLYARRCSVCHGDRGEVAVWAQGGLVPPPRNFTTDAARRELTRERMVFSVSYGRPETAMPSWLGRLTAEEIDSVVAYIQDAFLFPGGKGKNAPPEEKKRAGGGHDPAASSGEHVHDHYDTADMLLPLPKGLVGQVEPGEKFYKKNCVVCHGEKGDGKGPRSDFVYPKPRDFLHPSSRHKLNRAHLFEIINKGTRGTEMPAWGKVLTEQEIANVAEYVFQTFIRPGERPVTAPGAGGHEHHHAPPAVPVAPGPGEVPAAASAVGGHEHHPAPPAVPVEPGSGVAPAAGAVGGHEHHPAPLAVPVAPGSGVAPAAGAAGGHEHHPAPPAVPVEPGAGVAPAAGAAGGHEHHHAPPAVPVVPGAGVAPAAGAAGGHEHHHAPPAVPVVPGPGSSSAAGAGGHEHHAPVPHDHH